MFKEQFKETQNDLVSDLLHNIPQLINQEQNEQMKLLLIGNEVKQVVFYLNGNSASVPDSFSRQFFQVSWEVIGEDISNMVRIFFCGQKLHRYVTHTNLVFFT